MHAGRPGNATASLPGPAAPVVVFLFLQRYIHNGFAQGATK
ncbi:hypothetical protein AB0R01_07530 [Streptomyces rochei]|uniref:Sugar ABC transporter permease n=1 Tax=Streptomyces rochei TaxID=1928 RepID=A0ABW7E7F2_STRRO|nr:MULTISPECIES: hypothetical protein [Streptomyces]